MPDKTQMFTADQIDENSSTPLYQQIYDLLREKIIDGTVQPNEHLPAEQDLTRIFGVSRITVKRAMNELAVAGFVRRQRGIGTVVIYNAETPAIKGNFETMIDGLTRMGLETKVQLLDCTEGTASPAIAEALGIEVGTIVQRIVRMRLLDGEPLSHLITYIPFDIAVAYDESELATASLIDLLERAGHAPVEAAQTISATAAKPAVAANLGVAPGSPLLRIHRIMKDANGRGVQDITAHYRADRFEYHLRLARNNAAEMDWRTEK
ncbi:MAG: GntR family transcriptional regulator [Henriciella sp.]